MAVPVSWRDEWSLHIAVVDAEHRELVAKLGSIFKNYGVEVASDEPSGFPTLNDALMELGEAVREHFRREEELMETMDYDGIAEHRIEHALLMAEYTDMVRRWDAEGMTQLREDAQESMRDWILDHILGADRDFARAYFALGGDVSLVKEAPETNPL